MPAEAGCTRPKLSPCLAGQGTGLEVGTGFARPDTAHIRFAGPRSRLAVDTSFRRWDCTLEAVVALPLASSSAVAAAVGNLAAANIVAAADSADQKVLDYSVGR